MGQHQAHLSVYTKIAQHEANLPIDEQQHDEISQSTVSVVLAHGCSEERRKSTSAQLMFLPAHNRYSPFDPDLRSLSIFPFTRIQLTVARWKTTSWSTEGGGGGLTDLLYHLPLFTRGPLPFRTTHFPSILRRKGERWKVNRVERISLGPLSVVRHSSAIRSRFRTRKSARFAIETSFVQFFHAVSNVFLNLFYGLFTMFVQGRFFFLSQLIFFDRSCRKRSDDWSVQISLDRSWTYLLKLTAGQRLWNL